MAPCSNDTENGFMNGNGGDPETSDSETSDSEDDSDSDDDHAPSVLVNPRVALAGDDGFLQIYSINDADEFVYTKSLPRVKGEISTPLCHLEFFFLFLIFFLLSFVSFCLELIFLYFSGRVLSVTWSPDAQFIYSGSNDG